MSPDDKYSIIAPAVMVAHLPEVTRERDQENIPPYQSPF